MMVHGGIKVLDQKQYQRITFARFSAFASAESQANEHNIVNRAHNFDRQAGFPRAQFHEADSR
jgi:hypothetical protein